MPSDPHTQTHTGAYTCVTAAFVPVDSDTIGGSAGDAGMMSGGGGRINSSELGDKTAPSQLPMLPLLPSALVVGRTMADGTRQDDEPPAAFANPTPNPCADEAEDEAEAETNGRRINSMRNKYEMRTLLSHHVSKC